MPPAKPFKTYQQQLALLESRGLTIGSPEAAQQALANINYYRLSGYWYPFRQSDEDARADDFYPGTTFEAVVSLYEFDVHLRQATFAGLCQVEVMMRARLGHALGAVDPLMHLLPERLGPVAREERSSAPSPAYRKWLRLYERALQDSREDFVAHHQTRYGGTLPVWAAVEVLDWGALTWLFILSPLAVQATVAGCFGLTGPQLSSWMKSLNVVRNACAHQGRLFNKVHAIKPKMPRAGMCPRLDAVRMAAEGIRRTGSSETVTGQHWFGDRTFGQLTLVQHLLDQGGVGDLSLIPRAVKTYPSIQRIPLSHMGAPAEWQRLPLWKSEDRHGHGDR